MGVTCSIVRAASTTTRAHPSVIIGRLTDDDEPTADELEQLARSLAMDGSLGRHDAQRVADVLLEVAARRRHPSGGK